jgi:endonuclease/exonuclease/phosphatase family metal-dependent hydrolase
MMLQIVTTNIGGNRHTREVPLDPSRIAHEVRGILPIDPEQPVILAVQEVSRIWYRADQPLDTGLFLAAELGPQFKAYGASEVDSLTHPHRRAWSRITYEGAVRASEGNGIVTNLPLADWPWPSAAPNHPGYGNRTPLATSISKATLYSSGTRNTQPREVFVASLDTPFGPIFFMATHLATFENERQDSAETILSQASEERLFQVEQILNVVQEIRQAESARQLKPRPILLAGDFNAQPTSPEIQKLGSVFRFLRPRSASGSPATHIKHGLQIDHIFLSDPEGGFAPLHDCFVHQSQGIEVVTDHFPVVAVFKK